MSDKYPALSFDSMPVGVSYTRPSQPRPEGLSLDSPALDGMTDLRVLTALTVERTNTLSAALERMRKLGVRMLLVTGSTGAVMGIVTVTDIESGRAQKVPRKAPLLWAKGSQGYRSNRCRRSAGPRPARHSRDSLES